MLSLCYICQCYLSIELSHCNRFWIQDISLHGLIEWVFSLVLCTMEGLQCVSQDGVDSGLTSTSGSNQHDTMTHYHGLVQLDNLNVLEFEVKDKGMAEIYSKV